MIELTEAINILKNRIDEYYGKAHDLEKIVDLLEDLEQDEDIGDIIKNKNNEK